jgi:hypothetical protein
MKIRIKEADQNDQLLSQLKGEMSDLIGDMEDALEDKSKEQKEGILTTAGFVLAVPAILGLIAKFGKASTALFKKIVGEKPNDKKELEQYFARLGKLADNLHHLYMKPLEILMSKFIKDPTKSKKVANFVAALPNLAIKPKIAGTAKTNPAAVTKSSFCFLDLSSKVSSISPINLFISPFN